MKKLNNMPKENTKDVLEKIQKDLDTGRYWIICSNEQTFKDYVSSLIASLQAQHEKEIEDIANKEIEYWKNIFDNKPKDRNLESDNIAQNFARIEIEKWERRLIETDRWKKKVVRDGVEVYETSF